MPIADLIKDPNIFGIAIVRPFGLILLAIYNFVQNYGLTVIVFALLVKLVCIPLAVKGKKSMMAMSAMQKELQALQKKYANNREKLNDEMQKLYSKHGVSPMGGCLPQIIPLFVMMGLYYAVQQPLQYILGLGRDSILALGNLVGVTEGSYTVQITIAEQLNRFVTAGGTFPAEVMNCISSSDTAAVLMPLDFNFFGLNLANTPSLREPSLMWLIPLLSGATAFLSMRIMQKMQGNQQSAAAGQMKMLNILSPLMSLYFAFILPGAIGIYWIFNNVFTCLQEIVLTRHYRSKMEKKQLAEQTAAQAERAAKKAKNDAVVQQQKQQKGGK